MNELIKLTEVLKEHKGRWFTANEIGKKLDVKTFEAEKKLWQLEQAGIFLKRRYELRNTENENEIDKLHSCLKFLNAGNFEIIEYFRFDN